MRKVAVCISGHMRSFMAAYPVLYANLIEPNNADVFLSTWDVLGAAKHNRSEEESFQAPFDIAPALALMGDSLKGFAIHPFNQIQASLPKIFYPGLVSMFWQIYQANLLRIEYERKNNFQYELVARMRPDLMFNTQFSLDGVVLSDNMIISPLTNPHFITDQIAIANGNVMTWYCDMFNQLESYQEPFKSFIPPPGESTVFTPEQLLKYHLDLKGIQNIPLPLSCTLARTPFGDYS